VAGWLGGACLQRVLSYLLAKLFAVMLRQFYALAISGAFSSDKRQTTQEIEKKKERINPENERNVKALETFFIFQRQRLNLCSETLKPWPKWRSSLHFPAAADHGYSFSPVFVWNFP